MPITVTRGPSFASVGNAAYAAGRGAYQRYLDELGLKRQASARDERRLDESIRQFDVSRQDDLSRLARQEQLERDRLAASQQSDALRVAGSLAANYLNQIGRERELLFDRQARYVDNAQRAYLGLLGDQQQAGIQFQRDMLGFDNNLALLDRKAQLDQADSLDAFELRRRLEDQQFGNSLALQTQRLAADGRSDLAQERSKLLAMGYSYEPTAAQALQQIASDRVRTIQENANGGLTQAEFAYAMSELDQREQQIGLPTQQQQRTAEMVVPSRYTTNELGTFILQPNDRIDFEPKEQPKADTAMLKLISDTTMELMARDDRFKGNLALARQYAKALVDGEGIDALPPLGGGLLGGGVVETQNPGGGVTRTQTFPGMGGVNFQQQQAPQAPAAPQTPQALPPAAASAQPLPLDTSQMQSGVVYRFQGPDGRWYVGTFDGQAIRGAVPLE